MTRDLLSLVSKDGQQVDERGRLPGTQFIDGVQVRDIAAVLLDNGSLTEIFRSDWFGDLRAAHVFQRLLPPGEVAGWHAHANKTDRLFCGYGKVRVSLHDSRPTSATRGRSNVFRCGRERPQLIIVPPGVWHAVANIGTGDALLIDVSEVPYDYRSPDHWRLPADSPEIPIRP
jgi:dTDP-4-dehydrorhamnose 3,5-epimerase